MSSDEMNSSDGVEFSLGEPYEKDTYNISFIIKSYNPPDALKILLKKFFAEDSIDAVKVTLVDNSEKGA